MERNNLKQTGALVRLTPRQRVFYSDVVELIDANRGNPELSVSWLSGQIGISRSQLFRKVHAITGHSVSWLITDRKITYAKLLLFEAPMTIEEIALKAGFHSAAYFSRCFKDRYGMTPSKFLKNGI